jgi:hypothetical protein
MKKIETGRLHYLAGTSRKITQVLLTDGRSSGRPWRRNVPTKRLSITSNCINVNRGQVCRRRHLMCVTDGPPAVGCRQCHFADRSYGWPTGSGL